jgi:hypothetical protein
MPFSFAVQCSLDRRIDNDTRSPLQQIYLKRMRDKSDAILTLNKETIMKMLEGDSKERVLGLEWKHKVDKFS